MIAKFKKSEYLRKSMSLIDKIRNAGKVLGLVGGIGSLGLSGCNEVEYVGSDEDEQEIMAYMLGANSINPNWTPEQRAAAAYSARIIHERRVARDSANRIIIYDNSNNKRKKSMADEMFPDPPYLKNKHKKSMADEMFPDPPYERNK